VAWLLLLGTKSNDFCVQGEGSGNWRETDPRKFTKFVKYIYTLGLLQFFINIDFKLISREQDWTTSFA